MSYFKKFPKIHYEYKKNVFKKSVDILKRFGLTEKISTDASFWQEYEVKDSDTPESLANSIYGDPKKSWLILLANEIINPNYEWPLSSDKLYDRIVKKYEGIYLFGVGSPKESSIFESGYLRSGDVIEHTAGSRDVTGVVDYYDKTYKTIVLKDTVGTWPVVNDGENSEPFRFNKTEKYSSYGRRILEGWSALHHFEDKDGNHISPYESPTNSPYLGTTSNFLINLYGAKGGQREAVINQAGYKIITNYDYEVSKNESYRKIKILKQNVAKRVEETLSESMR